MLRRSAVLLALAALCAANGDQERGTRLLRSPTVSADRVAFVYAEDIWVAPRDGGKATRLTSLDGSENSPQFSPDGQTIAFSGQYDGNMDVYVIPATGGEPRRLTYHPAGDYVRGWTPDGKRIVFVSGRDHVPAGYYERLWTVPVEPGLQEPLPMPTATAGDLAPDGRHIAYVPVSPAFGTWRGYRGGRTTPIWIMDLTTYAIERVPRDNSNDWDPVWLGDTVYFLSDRNGTMNIFSYRPGTGEVEQVTHCRDFDVKALDGTGSALVYEQAGYLHLYDLETRTSKQLVINAQADLRWRRPRWVRVSGLIRGADISPTGQRAVFEARGDIFTVPAKKGDWRNLTQTPGVHECQPTWSPDGKYVAWFSDEGGEYHLVLGEQTGTQPLRHINLPNPTYYYDPVWSPDSKKLFYRDCQSHSYWLDIESGESTLIDTDDVSGWNVGEWSPDSRWIAYRRSLSNYQSAVFLYSLEQGKSFQVTDGMSAVDKPVFDRGGKYLYFTASTNVGPHVRGFDMSAYEKEVTHAIYLVVLAADTPSPFLPESDEETVKEEKPKAPEPPKQPEPPKEGDKPSDSNKPEDGETPSQDQSGGAAVGEAKPATPAAPAAEEPRTKIDLEGIEQRILPIGLPVGDYGSIAQGGKPDCFLYVEQVPGVGPVLKRYELKDREAKEVIRGVGGFAVSADGKKMLYSASGAWGIGDPNGSFGPGTGTINTGALEMKLDPPAEWLEAYTEAWRINRDFFYDPQMHGEDWQAMYDKYRPFVDEVVHRADLNYVISLMLGELVVGHSYLGGGDAPGVGGVNVGLLGADIEVDSGHYRIKRIYTGENWNPDLRSPLTAPGVKVSVGDYILEVNSRPITPPTDFYSVFEGTSGRQTVLKVNSKPEADGAWNITVVPIGSEGGLRRKAWIEDNRRKVEELSGGRLAYVYLPDTGGGGYSYFNRYFFSQLDKEGAVIDERFNGGGQIADYMVDFMDRPLMGYFGRRHVIPQPVPGAALFGPKVMIINEYAGSGGDCLPYMFRKRGIGPLIGTRTWGGLVGISGYPPLIDGGSVTAPSLAFYDTDGKWAIENEGVAPDIEVEQTPAELIGGRDPQLERAVAECLKLLETKGYKPVPQPPSINRTSWKDEHKGR